jgi:HSP20 family protein
MASRYLIPFGSRGLAGRGDPFLSLNREINRLFDDTFRGMDQGEGGRGQFLAPSLDVHESGDEFCVTADLPGVSPEDIDLQVEGDLLTICGESKREQERDDKGYHVMERSSGSFRRSLRLPFEPDPDQVNAECRNGVLTVHIPKAGQQQRSRKIAVGGGASQQQVEGRSWAANDERSEDRQMAASQGSQRQEGGSDDTGSPQAGENKDDVTTGGGV